MSNLEAEVYTKFLKLFSNDSEGLYQDTLADDELDENLSDKAPLNEQLKQDVEELIECISLSIKQDGFNKDNLNYSLITRKIYSMEDINGFDLITKLKVNYLRKSSEANDIIFKLLRHTELALVQKSSLSDKIQKLEKDLEKEIEKSKKLTKELQITSEQWERKLSETKGEMRKIMPEIIGVMGIFSTIIFAVFSGFNEITTLGATLNSTPLSKIFIYTGLSFIVLVGIVFVSYFSIGKFYNKSLRSCGCGDGEKCEHDLIEKYPSIAVFVWLGMTFIALGAMLLLFKEYIDLPVLFCLM